MERRTHETPMDFAWENGSGPTDSSSPFLTFSRQRMASPDHHARKRPHSVFDSPGKPAFPSLRDPASQPHFFNAPSPGRKLLPAVPDAFRGPAFTTPRKVETDFFSSGGETPNSPDLTAESDATPDTMALRDAQVKSSAEGQKSPSPSKSRRESLLGKLFGNPAGRGEVAKPYSRRAEKRITKRRKKDTDRRLARRHEREFDSDDEDEGDGRNGARMADARQDSRLAGFVGTMFSYLESHPQLPHVLSYYAQLMLNIFLVFFIMYIVYSFWAAIRSDVDLSSQNAVMEAMAEVARCAKDWEANMCEQESRVPAMETICNTWKKCMSRDPHAVARARISAHTFAQIFNSFIEPISYKAMVSNQLP
ncbi:Di-sulfide bridge nucleocytoplasmic transport domain-containing protein [Lineolata rhizophorae]|uniref:Di-sulfide bridge nucleocytoplasmic transport domain-containing protein n=1 Tax=Lineolata rhizophorae TaxID=578093 RepID=A0A6A6P1B8_9PEZI|nr:Di-sulfide bridge nucleocytoplasmic transport domain-containing protein [Lineolata rhizophorae]